MANSLIMRLVAFREKFLFYLFKKLPDPRHLTVTLFVPYVLLCG